MSENDVEDGESSGPVTPPGTRHMAPWPPEREAFALVVNKLTANGWTHTIIARQVGITAADLKSTLARSERCPLTAGRLIGATATLAASQGKAPPAVRVVDSDAAPPTPRSVAPAPAPAPAPRPAAPKAPAPRAPTPIAVVTPAPEPAPVSSVPPPPPAPAAPRARKPRPMPPKIAAPAAPPASSRDDDTDLDMEAMAEQEDILEGFDDPADTEVAVEALLLKRDKMERDLMAEKDPDKRLKQKKQLNNFFRGKIDDRANYKWRWDQLKTSMGPTFVIQVFPFVQTGSGGPSASTAPTRRASIKTALAEHFPTAQHIEDWVAREVWDGEEKTYHVLFRASGKTVAALYVSFAEDVAFRESYRLRKHDELNRIRAQHGQPPLPYQPPPQQQTWNGQAPYSSPYGSQQQPGPYGQQPYGQPLPGVPSNTTLVPPGSIAAGQIDPLTKILLDRALNQPGMDPTLGALLKSSLEQRLAPPPAGQPQQGGGISEAIMLKLLDAVIKPPAAPAAPAQQQPNLVMVQVLDPKTGKIEQKLIDPMHFIAQQNAAALAAPAAAPAGPTDPVDIMIAVADKQEKLGKAAQKIGLAHGMVSKDEAEALKKEKEEEEKYNPDEAKIGGVVYPRDKNGNPIMDGPWWQHVMHNVPPEMVMPVIKDLGGSVLELLKEGIAVKKATSPAALAEAEAARAAAGQAAAAANDRVIQQRQILLAQAKEAAALGLNLDQMAPPPAAQLPPKPAAPPPARKPPTPAHTEAPPSRRHAPQSAPSVIPDDGESPP